MDSYRVSCIRYFKQYLDEPDAQDIEHYIYDQTNGQREYQRKARLFLSALQRKTWIYNPTLLQDLAAADLNPKLWAPFKSAEEFVETTAAEQQKPVATSIYTCGKCKKNECTFYERQTRASDEGFTTFITCIHCGHKWKQ